MSRPAAYSTEIAALDAEIDRAHPPDVVQFCANFFNRRLESQRAHLLRSLPMADPARASPAPSAPASAPAMHRLDEEDEPESDSLASPTSAAFPAEPAARAAASPALHDVFANFAGFSPSGSAGRAPPSASASARSPAPLGDPQELPKDFNLNRRTSVSAESLNPVSSLHDHWTPPCHPKSADQQARLKAAVASNFLFAPLDEEQSTQILGALQEKPIPTKGIKVIQQGDVGDFFYVVEAGSFDIYVNPSGKLEPGPDGMGNKVASVGPGGSFGELALMYNAPRAATVASTAPSTLWALDRVTFRRILMDSAFQRRRMYEGFLEEVELLASLTPYERSKIADALETCKYPKGATIIREGDVGESFYILESGEAEVYKDGVAKPVRRYKKGDYFGELALLNDAPRAASVVSTTEAKVATLGKNGFQRLLGPVEGIMRRNDPSKQRADDSIDPLATGK